jgi:hypothetical protein
VLNKIINRLRSKEERYRPAWLAEGDKLTFTFDMDWSVPQDTLHHFQNVTGKSAYEVMRAMYEQGAQQVLQSYMPEGGSAVVNVRFFTEDTDAGHD